MPGVVLIILTGNMRIAFPFPRPIPGNKGRFQGVVAGLLIGEGRQPLPQPLTPSPETRASPRAWWRVCLSGRGASPSSTPHPIPGNKGRSQGVVANMMTYARKRGQAWQKQGSSLRRRR